MQLFSHVGDKSQNGEQNDDILDTQTHRVQSFFHHLSYKAIAAFYCVMLVVLVIVILSIHSAQKHTDHSSIKQADPAIALLNKLDVIQGELQQLTIKPQSFPEFQKTVGAINQELVSLHQTISQLAKAHDIEIVSSQLNTVKSDVDDQFTHLNTLLAEHHQQKRIVDASRLPFQVMSVDVISGRVLISVNFNHQILPLLVGDSLSGWQVVRASFDTQAVELRNIAGEFILVNHLSTMSHKDLA